MAAAGYSLVIWGALLCYFLWKRKGRKGWQGAIIGAIAGLVAFFLTAFVIALTNH